MALPDGMVEDLIFTVSDHDAMLEDTTLADKTAVSDGTLEDTTIPDVTAGVTALADITAVGLSDGADTMYKKPLLFWLMQVFQIFLIIIILVANFLIMAAIKESKKLQKLTFYLLGGVAVGDVSFGFALGSRFFLEDKWNGYGCMLCTFFVLLSTLAFFSCVMFTCLRNFISVKFYAFSKNGFSERSAKLIVVGIWVFWTILSGSSFITADVSKKAKMCYIGNEYYSNSFMVMISVVALAKFIFVISIQAYTIVVIKQQHMHTQGQLNAQVEHMLNSVKLRNIQRAAKVTKIITSVLILTLFCWRPLLVACLVLAVCPHACSITGVTIGACAALLFINSFGNVFIYGVKSEEFREAFRKMFRCGTQVSAPRSTQVT